MKFCLQTFEFRKSTNYFFFCISKMSYKCDIIFIYKSIGLTRLFPKSAEFRNSFEFPKIPSLKIDLTREHSLVQISTFLLQAFKLWDDESFSQSVTLKLYVRIYIHIRLQFFEKNVYRISIIYRKMYNISTQTCLISTL